MCVYAFHIYINILQVTFHQLSSHFLKISETGKKKKKTYRVGAIPSNRNGSKMIPWNHSRLCVCIYTPPRLDLIKTSRMRLQVHVSLLQNLPTAQRKR